jgi:hypothetical protein
MATTTSGHLLAPRIAAGEVIHAQAHAGLLIGAATEGDDGLGISGMDAILEMSCVMHFVARVRSGFKPVDAIRMRRPRDNGPTFPGNRVGCVGHVENAVFHCCQNDVTMGA